MESGKHHRARVKIRAWHLRQIRGRGDRAPVDGTRITMRGVVHTALEGVLSVDKGVFRTLGELFWRPGYMIRDYIQGKRECYTRPFTLLFVLAAFFLIADRLFFPENYVREETVNYQTITNDIHTLRGLARTDSARFYLDQMQRYADRTLSVEVADMTDSLGVENMESMNRYWESMNNIRENYLSEDSTTGQIANLVSGWFSGNVALIFLFMLPVFLICSRFIYYRVTPVGKNMNTAEYIVAFVYVSCQLIALGLLLLPLAKLLGPGTQPMMWLMPLVLTWDYKQLFGLSWWGSLWRIILLVIASGLFMTGANWLVSAVRNLFFALLS